MKFEAATIKDIAKALGLSTSSVSRALRDSHEISLATKKKVLAYAKEINYKPNPIALSLKEKRSRTIGVIVPEIANSFFSQVINGIESVAIEKNYNVLISQSHEILRKEEDAINFLCSRSVDGIVISVSSETKENSLIKQYNERGLPVVCVDRVLDDINTHKIGIANYKAGYDATYHLIKNGFKKIAFLGGSINNNITKERFAGFKDAMDKYNVAIDENFIGYCGHGGIIYDEVEASIKRILNKRNKPTALFAAGDKLTTNVLRYCNKNKIAIPEQLGLIGFSNLDLTELLFTPLSVVRQPAFEMGKIAAQKIIETIESKHPVTQFENMVLPAELVVRASTRMD
jgi:DNA-binding LacI/PurR family transcriptional regulator